MSFLLNRVPKTANVMLPGFRQAATFRLMFDYRELPIDPRLIRAIGVEIFQGAVDPNDFATGMVSVDPIDGSRRSVLKVTGPTGIRDDLLTMAGVVDTWKMTHDDTGSWLEIEGRDLRGIFLDSPIDLNIFRSMDLARPIHEVVADIVETHPAGEDMYVDAWPDEWTDNFIPSPADRDGLTRPRRKANGTGATVSTPSSGPNYWDIITQLCTLVGGIPTFVGRNLEIRPARSIFAQLRNPINSPFDRPRFDEDGRNFTTRRMIFGRNLKSLSFERKYTGVRVPVIEVVSLDTSSKERGAAKLLVERWPPKDKALALASGVAPSGEAAQTDVIRISKPGIRSRERLLEIAKDIYEEIGRQEMGGTGETKSLASFGGSNSDPDMLHLKPGDGVEFLVDTGAINSRSPIVSQFTEANRRSFGEQVAQLRRDMSTKGAPIDENLARVLAATTRSSVVDLLRFYRIMNVKYGWNRGVFNCTFDFQNYIVARAGSPDQPDERQTRSRAKARKRIRTKTPRATPSLDSLRRRTRASREGNFPRGTRFDDEGNAI